MGAGIMGERVARAVRLRRSLGPFFERARAPVIVVEHDGRFASANDAALKQYGYELEELAAMNIADLMAAPRRQLPADLDHAYRGDPAPLERRAHRRRDGSV